MWRHALTEIGVKASLGVSVQITVPKVHEQKRKVVEDIRLGECVIEFKRVDKCGMPMIHHDVAQVKIAVAQANATRFGS